MQLSDRMLAVSAAVTEGSRLADVGTDHGYIPIYLCGQGRIPSAIAMDVHKGPLERARKHIHMYGMEDKIETRLSDGVAALAPGEADCVVIAGMGGGLVQKILVEGQEVLLTVKELVLQPQSELAMVRTCLQEHEYMIEREWMVFEDGKYYPLMRIVHGSMEPLSDIELRYGRHLLGEKNTVLAQYLLAERQNLECIRERLIVSGTKRSSRRMQEVEDLLEMNRRAAWRL